MIKIRPFKAEDSKETYQLFYDTVHTINAKDYSKEKLDAWAPKEKNMDDWCIPFLKNYSFVAIDTQTNHIVGFSDMEENGYLDHSYVHKDFQRQGVGQLLLNAIEQKAKALGLRKIFSDISITAKPFFEHNHFKCIRKQIKLYQKMTFIQYRVEKKLIESTKFTF